MSNLDYLFYTPCVLQCFWVCCIQFLVSRLDTISRCNTVFNRHVSHAILVWGMKYFKIYINDANDSPATWGWHRRARDCQLGASALLLHSSQSPIPRMTISINVPCFRQTALLGKKLLLVCDRFVRYEIPRKLTIRTLMKPLDWCVVTLCREYNLFKYYNYFS
jgi:hypothetical protein